MKAAALRKTPSDPFTDLLYMIVGTVVSWVQWMDLTTLNEGLGAAVAALTLVLLCYRIYLAHMEVTTENEAQT